jgi:hypothetical protein
MQLALEMSQYHRGNRGTTTYYKSRKNPKIKQEKEINNNALFVKSKELNDAFIDVQIWRKLQTFSTYRLMYK